MFSMPDAIVVASLLIAGGMVLSGWLLSRHRAAKFPAPAQPFPLLPAMAALPPLSAEALPVEPSGIAVEPETRLEVGAAVLANWNGVWWRAQVIGLERDGRVRIHYAGWDSSWDETVSRGNLQMDISGSVRA